MNSLVVFAHRQRELKNVVGLAELDLLLPIGRRLESVDDHVERFSLQRRYEGLPIRRNKLGLAAHGRRERLDHLFLITDVLIGMLWIVKDIRRATAGIGAPT